MKLFFIGAAITFFALTAGPVRAACPAPAQTGQICVETITWAKDPQTGDCCYYSTPCQAPQGWVKYNSESDCAASVANKCGNGVCDADEDVVSCAIDCAIACPSTPAIPACAKDHEYRPQYDQKTGCITSFGCGDPISPVCGNGVCEPEESVYYCIDCARGATDCVGGCRPACPQDCPASNSDDNGTINAPTAIETPNNGEIKQQITQIRLQLINLIQQLIDVLKGMIPQ